MKVVVNGKEYKIWFKHTMLDGARYKALTTCWVEGAGRPWPGGQALCVAGDQFKKSIGRKIALSRAIYGFTRDERREIWKQYFDVVGRG